MKNILFIFLSVTILFSCETKKSVTSELQVLQTKRGKLLSENNSLRSQQSALKKSILSLNEEYNIDSLIATQATHHYVLKLKLKQVHYSLDLTKHIKDAANSIEFELPVSLEMYKQVKVGDNIVDRFRIGSLLLSGDFGDWRMQVVNKTIRTD